MKAEIGELVMVVRVVAVMTNLLGVLGFMAVSGMLVGRQQM
jgi:hypothetical protein